MVYVQARAPINIALIKYWGKQDETNVTPFNPSISLSLSIFHTTTRLERYDGPFYVEINGTQDAQVTHKVATFLTQFTDASLEGIRVITHNSGPTAAGLASSASGFAALAKAAQAFFEGPYDDALLAQYTRKGSGSAVRSLQGPCVLWRTDGTTQKIAWPFKDAKVAFMILDAGQKRHPSTPAMKHTVATAPSYPEWVKQSHHDAAVFETLCAREDFSQLGALAERNALAMHAVCADAHPPIHYLTDASWRVIQAVQEARAEKRFEAYCTMDAGPNVKLLYQASDEEAIRTWAHELGLVTPLFSAVDDEGAVVLHEQR